VQSTVANNLDCVAKIHLNTGTVALFRKTDHDTVANL
jgi:hypothetical protein